MGKFSDLTGQRFGKLVAVKPTEQKQRRSIVWECVCDCGGTAFVSAKSLRSGNTQSCGCLNRRVDLTGQRFGMLIAVRPTDERTNGQVVWECICDCGNTAFVTAGNLRYAHTQSCGCDRVYVDGTSINHIRNRKLQNNNTTGCRGVSFFNGSYSAYITFRRKFYQLGRYSQFEDAVKVRKKAEALLYDQTVDYFALWRAKAEADPCWAEEHPIKIRVVRDSTHDFTVYFEPEL